MSYEIALDADPVVDFPVDLQTVKTALRIDHSEFDHVIQTQYLPAAVMRLENFMRRAISSRVHRWTLCELPSGRDQTLYLPRGKVTAVASVVVSVDGSPLTLRGATSGSPVGTDYQEALDGDSGARLLPPRGESWPVADDDVVSPVVVTFTAGWPVASMPEEIRQGVITAIADQLDISPADQVGTPVGALASAGQYAEQLVSAWRILG